MKNHPPQTLTPLDQLLINVQGTDSASAAGSPEWRFFLGFSTSDELVVADAKGSTSKVRWMDVGGVAKRQVIIVRALTIQAIKEREKARQLKEPYEPCWLPATVLMAVLDPVTKRIDGFRIRQSNGEELLSAGPDIVHVDDYVRLVHLAIDGAMPVLTPVPSAPVCPKPEEYRPLARPLASYDRHIEALIAAESEASQIYSAEPQIVDEGRELPEHTTEAYDYRRAARALARRPGNRRNA